MNKKWEKREKILEKKKRIEKSGDVAQHKELQLSRSDRG